MSAAFSQYRPSANAHTDFLNPGGDSGSNKGKDIRVISLKPKIKYVEKPIQGDLTNLIDSIGPILKGQAVKQSYHNLSAACHRLVLPPHNSGQELYSRIERDVEASLLELSKGWQRLIMAREPNFLGRFIEDWRAWEKRVELLSSIFVYLDRIYVSGNLLSIRRLAVQAFARSVWGQDIIRGKIIDSIMTWVTEERVSSKSNAPLRLTVISIIDLTRLLGVFESLSSPYIALANTHFSEVAEVNMMNVEGGKMSPTGYIEWVTEQVKAEDERARATMSAEVAGQVVNVVRVQAGYKMSKRIVSRALEEAMHLSDGDALSRLYGFSVDVQVFGEFVECLKTNVEERLKKLISDPANDSKMIDETLVLKRFADRSIVGLFARDEEAAAPVDSAADKSGLNDDDDEHERPPAPVGFSEVQRKLELEDAVRKGFRSGMSIRENAPAEWIAKHLDAVMRRGQGSGTEAEFDSQLEEIIALIGFTPDKDVFKAFYSTQLAKRLLLNKSASDDMERNMIIKLQQEMGEEFTSGDIMMKDLQLSETLVRSYQTARSKNPDGYKDPGNLTANVLTESAWPAYPQLKDGWNFKLTPELQSSIDAFTEWYATQHRNRQLSWRPQLGTVTLTARFESGKYEIGVSLFQAIVLLHFNDDNSLDVKEIQARTGIEQKELVRVLQSLSMGRKGTRVLVKKPPGKEVAPTDMFLWNKAFNSDRIKFRINQIQQDLSAEESKKTNEQVAIDRVSVLEATIVRIMKGRKTLTLQLLIDAVVSDVSKRFPPDVKEMKKRVESLIEREFLMRDDDDRNLLHYLA